MTKHLLEKFINNSCSEEEHDYVYSWISDLGNKEEVSAMMKLSWDKMSDKMPEDVRSKRSYIRNVLQSNNDHKFLSDLENTLADRDLSKSKRLINKWSVMKIAASVVLAIGISFLVYKQISNVSMEVDEVVFIEKTNPNGRKSTIILPDGSKVKLNSDSKIRYAKTFTKEYREVILEGEAFFEVVKDRVRPFVIKTGDITTTVLGTSFNVNAYAKRDEISVAVVTGKVEVKKSTYYGNEESTTTYLTPNMMAVYKRDERELKTTHFNMEEITGWKDGILIFKNTDMPQIAMKLKKWYGLEVEISGGKDILRKRYTGKFDNNSLEYVLKAISYTSEISFEIEDNKKIILKQK
ncbi:MAG: transmembrane sensor [Bacteroidia bacterium]|jgi:transmembrane sensor